MVGAFTPYVYNHFVWVRNSAGGTNGQYAGSTLYVNGEIVQLQQDSQLPGAPVIDVTSTTFRVHAATDEARYFSGTVDEVVLYDHLLTPADIAVHFAAIDRSCPADLNGDHAVGLSDLTILLSHFGSGSAMCGEGDLDRDNDVDLNDLTAFLAEFGVACP